jgi:hypothetical protein
MPLTTNYDQWMKETHSTFKARSEALKKLDSAIKLRNEIEAKRALKAWIDEQNSKRQDWQRSVRNEKGAVKRLYDQLGMLGAAPTFKNIGAELNDKLAKKALKDEMRQASAKMFTGKEIAFKLSFWGVCNNKCKAEASKIERAKVAASNTVGTAQGVGTKLYEAQACAKNIKTIVQSIMGTLPAQEHSAIIELVFGQSVEQFAFNAAPILGLITSGGRMVQEWVGLAMKISDKIEMEAAHGNVRPGDAAAALTAIGAILDRQIKKQAVDAATRTTAFTAKGASAIADFGTATTSVIGAVESIALLLNTLVDVVIDAKEKIAGNKLLKEGKIDIELFNTCPILGCYYIVIQDHSTIMNFDIENMGRENWQQEALRLRYALDPVIRKASDLVSASRIEIPGMATAKGVYQSTFIDKLVMKYKAF